MTPKWEPSSDKHGVPRGDQIFAILNATFVQRLVEVDDRRGGVVQLFIGPPHGQTSRELEILVREYPDGREAIIFHAMELGPKFRQYRQENSND